MSNGLRQWRQALAKADGLPDPTSEGPDGESATQRVTRRNKEMLDGGVHPATLKPLLIGVVSCGSCAHHHAYRYHNGIYHKCELHRLGESHSNASDIRISWPACVLYEPRPDDG